MEEVIECLTPGNFENPGLLVDLFYHLRCCINISGGRKYNPVELLDLFSHFVCDTHLVCLLGY